MSIERVANLVLTAAALVLTAVIVRRELFPGQGPAMRKEARATEVRRWRDLSSAGSWIGDSTARVVLTEFDDYQCPFCKAFHERLMAVRDSLTEPIGILYIEFPLPSHRFAVPAGNAAMCAAEQGRFEAMHDVLFREQEVIGLKPWDELAQEAGVPDLKAFSACHSLTERHPRVARGAKISDSLKILYTPTVMINQWRYATPPIDSLRGISQAAINKTR